MPFVVMLLATSAAGHAIMTRCSLLLRLAAGGASSVMSTMEPLTRRDASVRLRDSDRTSRCSRCLALVQVRSGPAWPRSPCPSIAGLDLPKRDPSAMPVKLKVGAHRGDCLSLSHHPCHQLCSEMGDPTFRPGATPRTNCPEHYAVTRCPQSSRHRTHARARRDALAGSARPGQRPVSAATSAAPTPDGHRCPWRGASGCTTISLSRRDHHKLHELLGHGVRASRV